MPFYEGYNMNRNNVIQSNIFQRLLTASIKEFDPTITISADQRALCINGQPVIAKDTTVFSNGVLLQGFGKTLAEKINYRFNDEKSSVTKMSDFLRFAFYPMDNLNIHQDFIRAEFLKLSQDDQNELVRLNGSIEPNKNFIESMTYNIQLQMSEHMLSNSDHEAVEVWLNDLVDQGFKSTIKEGLRFGEFKNLYQYIAFAQAKDAFTAFLKKYPLMTPMLRPIWEAHEANPELNLLGQIKTLEDLERGEFMVEQYNQDYNYYNCGFGRQKKLADAQSWQWLLLQPKKTINLVMKQYCVNDNQKDHFCYHSFGRIRENLSVIAQLNIDPKLAHVFLNDLIVDSISYDRFAICVNRNQGDLDKQDFHSGQKYRDNVNMLFSYMDHKGMDLDTRIKFLKTFKKRSPLLLIPSEVRYQKNYRKSELSEFEIIDAWVLKEFAKIKKVDKNSYIPESVVNRVKELIA